MLMAKLTLNRKVLNIIKEIPFFANLRQKPNLFDRVKNNKSV